jgi:hypothetical protein
MIFGIKKKIISLGDFHYSQILLLKEIISISNTKIEDGKII